MHCGHVGGNVKSFWAPIIRATRSLKWFQRIFLSKAVAFSGIWACTSLLQRESKMEHSTFSSIPMLYASKSTEDIRTTKRRDILRQVILCDILICTYHVLLSETGLTPLSKTWESPWRVILRSGQTSLTSLAISQILD